VLGHEGAGIVESVGEGVTTVVQGDHANQFYNQFHLFPYLISSNNIIFNISD